MQRAIEKHPKEEMFWFTAGKQMWDIDPEKARSILEKGLSMMKDNENLVLLYSKFEK